MASFHWPRTKSLFNRFLPVMGENLTKKETDLDPSKAFSKANTHSNEKYLSTLTQGGFWLS